MTLEARRVVWLIATVSLILMCLPHSARADETYRFFAPDAGYELSLRIHGLENGTTYQVFDMDDMSTPLAEGVVDRFELAVVDAATIPGPGHYMLVTDKMVLALAWNDGWGQQYGGTVFYPASDGRTLVGSHFIVDVPIISGFTEFVVLAYEDSYVTILDENGSTVADATVLADTYWKPAIAAETF